MFHLSYEYENIALSNLALCTHFQCYALRVNMPIFSQANNCTCACGFVVCVVFVCPIIIKLGQMIEEVCALHCVKDVNF